MSGDRLKCIQVKNITIKTQAETIKAPFLEVPAGAKQFRYQPLPAVILRYLISLYKTYLASSSDNADQLERRL